MAWVFGNIADCAPVETFANSLRNPAPVTGFTVDEHIDSSLDDFDAADEVEGTLPRTLEACTRTQETDPAFASLLDAIEDKACRHQLWISAPAEGNPRIIVPPSCQELRVRDVHSKMFHPNHQKISVIVERSYFWPALRKDATKFLDDCPECKLQKVLQNIAHGLFHSFPIHAPRARWCMDFQGQSEVEIGEREALALIDPTSRYVVVLALKDREASTWLQPFLDIIVFGFGPPEGLHSDVTTEFLAEAVELLAEAADIHTTTTMGHNARGNGTV